MTTRQNLVSVVLTYYMYLWLSAGLLPALRMLQWIDRTDELVFAWSEKQHHVPMPSARPNAYSLDMSHVCHVKTAYIVTHSDKLKFDAHVGGLVRRQQGFCCAGFPQQRLPNQILKWIPSKLLNTSSKVIHLLLMPALWLMLVIALLHYAAWLLQNPCLESLCNQIPLVLQSAVSSHRQKPLYCLQSSITMLTHECSRHLACALIATAAAAALFCPRGLLGSEHIFPV